MEIKIGTYEYEVQILNETLYLNGQEVYGDIDYSKLIIRICGLYPKQIQFSTLLHEIGHAIINEYKIIDCSKIIDEEVLVDTMALGFTQFIKYNKEVLDYFMREDDKHD
jgi:hypothetical protein